jgi:hypothetical protein
MSDRLCACGCGEVLTGRRSQRYAGESHRMRALRSRQAAEEQVEGAVATRVDVGDHADPPAPSNGSMGRVRVGLEAWLKTREGLPEVLVSAARVLADELDAASDSSPLWGRYTVLMQALTEPQFQEQAFGVEVRKIYEEFATMEAAESWRHRRYLKAVDDGEPHPDRWTKLVPFGCLLDRHNWHQWGGPESPRTCLDCRGRVEDDGVVRWPSRLVGSLWEEEP